MLVLEPESTFSNSDWGNNHSTNQVCTEHHCCSTTARAKNNKAIKGEAAIYSTEQFQWRTFKAPPFVFYHSSTGWLGMWRQYQNKKKKVKHKVLYLLFSIPTVCLNRLSLEFKFILREACHGKQELLRWKKLITKKPPKNSEKQKRKKRLHASFGSSSGKLHIGRLHSHP